MQNNALVEALNDLIHLNCDRIKGYRTTIEKLNQTNNTDLHGIFGNLVVQGEIFNNDLKALIIFNGYDVPETTCPPGTIYENWKVVNNRFTGQSRSDILCNSETIEAATQEAYEAAMNDFEVTQQTLHIVKHQKTMLKKSYDELKVLCAAS